MLKGKNIYLRTIKDSDIDTYLELDSNLQDRGSYYPLSIDTEVGFKKWYNDTGLWDDNFGRMVICNKNDELVGYINYFKTTGYYEALEIGYIIFSPENRGKGYTTEALELFSDYLFKAKKITRLEIRVNPLNVGSAKVAQKVGFTFEGLNRATHRKAGKLQDMELYSFTILDWEKKQ